MTYRLSVSRFRVTFVEVVLTGLPKSISSLPRKINRLSQGSTRRKPVVNTSSILKLCLRSLEYSLIHKLAISTFGICVGKE